MYGLTKGVQWGTGDTKGDKSGTQEEHKGQT